MCMDKRFGGEGLVVKAVKTSLLKPYKGWELKLDWCNLEIDTFKAVKVKHWNHLLRRWVSFDIRSDNLLKYALISFQENFFSLYMC